MNNPVESTEHPYVWRLSPALWSLLACTLLSVFWLYLDAIQGLVQVWEKREEYSFGYLIPFISAFLIWQRKDRLERIAFKGSIGGILVLLVGLSLYAIGNMSTFIAIMNYSLVIVLFGVVIALSGWKGYKILWVPVAFLLFMVPIPGIFINGLSQALQLISSELGVFIIRLFGISVYLEGNVIDLGVYKLQVVEACSGLRYLFPLMAIGFICAYFYTGVFWKKIVIFMSSIPISIVMNSIRIGIIGAMVEYKGIAMAEGFLHDFEGWVVFMACTATLIFEMWILSRIGKDRLPFYKAFGIDMPEPTPRGMEIRSRKIQATLVYSLLLVLAAASFQQIAPERDTVKVKREVLENFPSSIDGWRSTSSRIEKPVLDVLQLDDYIIRYYQNSGSRQGAVSLYIAYHDLQLDSKTSHSPSSCLPGGGWVVDEITQIELKDTLINGLPLRVNRVLITKGDVRQLTYYWFQQRGRNITNEHILKLSIFWDSLLKRRTDGALVRLVTPIGALETIDSAEQRVGALAKIVAQHLPKYVPN